MQAIKKSCKKASRATGVVDVSFLVSILKIILPLVDGHIIQNLLWAIVAIRSIKIFQYIFSSLYPGFDFQCRGI
jgi:hypothetical protein